MNDNTEGMAEVRNYPYRSGKYDIVSIVAYLIGVPKRIFDNEYEPPLPAVYEKLDKNKHARIVRNLCMVRTAIERNFKSLNDAMRYSYQSLLMVLPEYLPYDCIQQLSADGVNFIRKSSTRLQHHIVEINRLLTDRINNCKDIFPIWLNWNYIRPLFLMPDGLTAEGTSKAAALYYAHLNEYPYQVYINWTPADEGNILYNDHKFVTLLYQCNNDEFADLSKVTDVGEYTKGEIYDFLNSSEKAAMVVDCENSDPYKLFATLRGLAPEMVAKISKIMLYDDVHTAPIWRVLETMTPIPVEHIMIERLKQTKSLVDIRLTAGTCREFYQNSVDSFVIVSSDSDYWGLISSLPEARFLVMVERDKCGADMKKALAVSNIFFCYLDDFYSGNSDDIKVNALVKEVYRILDRTVQFNARALMEEAYRVTRISMSAGEKEQFYHKYIKPMHLVIDKEGNVSVELQGT